MASSVITVFILAFSFATLSKTSASSGYARAVIESCQGCSLNRLPDVKHFIFDDVPYYDRVEFQHIQAAIPKLILYDQNDKPVERLELSHLTREECNQLLVLKGFRRDAKPAKDEI